VGKSRKERRGLLSRISVSRFGDGINPVKLVMLLLERIRVLVMSGISTCLKLVIPRLLRSSSPLWLSNFFWSSVSCEMLRSTSST